MRISDWSSDVCSSDLLGGPAAIAVGGSLLAAAQAGAFANIPLLADIEPWRIVLLLFAVSSLLLPLALLTIREPPRGAATNVDSPADLAWFVRSEEHTSELQSLMRSSYAVFCLKKKTKNKTANKSRTTTTNI